MAGSAAGFMRGVDVKKERCQFSFKLNLNP